MTITRIGGSCVSMVRICTGEVCVRSTGGGSLPRRGRQIERVVVGARRMMRRDVQRAEIVPVAFDVRTLGDGAAHGAEDRGDFLHGAADRVDQAGLARTRRQGRIDAARRRGGRPARRFPARGAGPRSPRSARPSAGSARRRVRAAAPAGSCRGRAAARSACRCGRARRCGPRPRRAGRWRRRARPRSRSSGLADRRSLVSRTCKGPPGEAAPVLLSVMAGRDPDIRPHCGCGDAPEWSADQARQSRIGMTS